MKYENAGDILPQSLLTELQKYASGKLLYIPSGDNKRAWGETTGYRNQLQKRNQMIRNKYAHGITVSELADEYYLSLDSIKKIIYSKKNNIQLCYESTVASAVHYAQFGMLEEWLQTFLLFNQNSMDSNECSLLRGELIFGVIKFPLRLIEVDNFDATTASERDKQEIEWDNYSPLLVHYAAGKFYSRVQNGLFLELKRRRLNAYPSIILMKNHDDYKRFMKWFGSVFIYVDQL